LKLKLSTTTCLWLLFEGRPLRHGERASFLRETRCVRARRKKKRLRGEASDSSSESLFYPRQRGQKWDRPAATRGPPKGREAARAGWSVSSNQSRP
jgi:hypothetical protein